MKSDFLWSIFFLFIIYNVKYVFLFGVGTSHLIILILAAFSLFTKAKLYSTHIMLVIGVLICSLLSVFLNLGADFDLIYVRFCIYSLISLVAASVILKIMSDKHRPKYDIFKFYGYAAFINSVFIFLMFIFPAFKSGYLSLVNLEVTEMYGDSVMDSMLALRMVGVTGFSVYSTAFSQMLCLILYYIYATHYRDDSNKLKVFDYLIVFSVITSSLIVSRSTVVGLGFLIVLMLFDKKNIANNFLFLFISVIILGAAFSSLSLFLNEDQFSFFTNWVLEFFNKGFEAGSVESNLSMYKYSWDDFTLLGDARMNDSAGGYYMHTDVGYFRMLFSAGYIGFFSLICLMFVILRPIYFHRKKIMLFVLIIQLYIFVFLLKGSVITDISHFFVTLSLCGFVFLNKNKEEQHG